MAQFPEPAARGSVPSGAPVEGVPRDAPGRVTTPTPPSPRRLAVAIVLGAAVSAVGGLILGEYPFTGVTPYIAGVLFALVVAEVIISISRQSSVVTAAAAAVCTVGGLGWAVWISTGKGIDPVPIGGWMALVVGAVVALARGGMRTVLRPGGGSRPAA